MRRSRTKWLKMSAFALVVANMITMPSALSAIAELREGGGDECGAGNDE